MKTEASATIESATPGPSLSIAERVENILADGRSGIWTEMLPGMGLRVNEDVLRSLLDMEFHAAVGDLLAALNAATGYMQNVAIDLQTGTPKQTTLNTLNGGLALARAAIARAEGR